MASGAHLQDLKDGPITADSHHSIDSLKVRILDDLCRMPWTFGLPEVQVEASCLQDRPHML